ALVLMELNYFAEASKIWMQLVEHDPEDWEARIQLAGCAVAGGDEEKAHEMLKQLREATEETEVLIETAKMFENLRAFGNAALCFQLALKQNPEQAVAWHGLGWNLWHADGSRLGIDY